MASVEFLQEFLSRVADGAYVVDNDQRIAAWNPVAEEILGFRAKDVIGQPCHQILGGLTDGGCVACRRGCMPFTTARRGQLVPSFDVQVRTAYGQPRWINVSIIAFDIPGAEGAPGAVVVHLFRDLEAKKRAEMFATEVSAWARQLNFHPSEVDGAAGEHPLPSVLSKREYQVLELLSQGVDTDAIAARLVIERSTARNHIQRIMHKLNVHSRLEAVTYAREHHLLD